MKSIVEGFAFCCDHGVDDGEREKSHVHKGDGGPFTIKGHPSASPFNRIKKVFHFFA